MAITFDSIGNGELAAMFQMELAKIGKNILDPNTDPEAVRSMSINIRFKPGKNGTIASVYDIKSKLAGPKKSETVFLIGQDAHTGRIEMSEYGSSRIQVAAYEPVPPVSGLEGPEQMGQAPEFDRETGEIFHSSGKPLDLRQMAAGR